MKLMNSAAIVLALALPAMANAATDGTPGATSTGSFSATLTLEEAPGSIVSVVGLDDFEFGTQILDNVGALNGTETRNSPFCVSRSDAGNVLFKVSQAYGLTAAQGFVLVEGGGIDTDTDGQTRMLGIEVSVETLQNSTPFSLQQDTAVPLTPIQDCSASPNPDSHRLTVHRPALPSGQKAGVYSGLFTVTVTPQ